MEEGLELFIKNNKFGRYMYENAFKCDKIISEMSKNADKYRGKNKSIYMIEKRHYVRCSNFFKSELEKIYKQFSKLK